MKRRNRLVRVVALVLVVLLALGAVVSVILSMAGVHSHAHAEAEAARDRYVIDAEFLEQEQALRVSQRLVYTNRTGGALDRVLFSVYGNVFLRESALMYEGEDLLAAFPMGYAPGGFAFSRITVDGEDADWGLMGEGELFLRVACDLGAGESCEFDFAYTLLLTRNAAFLGAGDVDWRLGGFFPQALKWEDGAFVAVAPIAHARYTYADRADYELSISLPDRYDIAAPGEISSRDGRDGATDWHVSAAGLREFSVSFGMRWREYAGVSDAGTAVRVLSSNRAGARTALDAALEALNFCEGHFGALGGGVTVAQSDHFAALPLEGLLLLPSGRFSDAASLKMDIRRGIARQFFGYAAYSMPTEDAWLSDAVSEYVAYMALEDADGHDAFLREINRALVPAVQYTVPGGLEITGDARIFSADEYDTIVRRRGALVLHELRSAMGGDALLDALRRFVERGRAADVLGEYDLVDALDAASGGSWEAFLTDWLYNIDQYQQQYIDWLE